MIKQFLSTIATATIGTIDKDGLPFCSYAPYIYDNNRFYIYISDIATHTKNLHVRPNASLFFIEDESKSSNLFARKRISLQCESCVILRDSERFEEVLSLFGQKFESSMIATFKNMLDFNLFELHVSGGEATFGFGDAYFIGGESINELIPRQSVGHKSKN